MDQHVYHFLKDGLAMMLSEVHSSMKKSNDEETSQPKSDSVKL